MEENYVFAVARDGTGHLIEVGSDIDAERAAAERLGNRYGSDVHLTFYRPGQLRPPLRLLTDPTVIRERL